MTQLTAVVVLPAAPRAARPDLCVPGRLRPGKETHDEPSPSERDRDRLRGVGERAPRAPEPRLLRHAPHVGRPAPRLANDYQVISWSMRGHGQTESPAIPSKYSADLTVADMAALLRHLGVQRAVIGGLSLGGYASLGFYSRPSGDGPRPRHLRLGPRLPQRGGARRLESARPGARGRAGKPRARRAQRPEPGDARGHGRAPLGPGPRPRRARHAGPGGLAGDRRAGRACRCPR